MLKLPRAEEIETDRDAFTFAPTTVAVSRTVLETSYSFIDNRVGPEAHSVPELLARFGVGVDVRQRLGMELRDAIRDRLGGRRHVQSMGVIDGAEDPSRC